MGIPFGMPKRAMQELKYKGILIQIGMAILALCKLGWLSKPCLIAFSPTVTRMEHHVFSLTIFWTAPIMQTSLYLFFKFYKLVIQFGLINLWKSGQPVKVCKWNGFLPFLIFLWHDRFNFLRNIPENDEHHNYYKIYIIFEGNIWISLYLQNSVTMNFWLIWWQFLLSTILKLPTVFCLHTSHYTTFSTLLQLQ